MILRTLLPFLLLVLPLSAQVRVFRVDDNHTVLGFKASTLLFDVPGRFIHYKADIQGDPAAPDGAEVQIDIDARSISSAILPLDRLDFGLGSESVAAKIRLKRQVDLDLLLGGFFEEAPAPVKPVSSRSYPGAIKK
jgi:hypothetical protein